MSERKRRLYRAVVTETPPYDERSPFGTGPHVASTVPRRIIRGSWWNEEIVYLAQEHAPIIDQYENQAEVDPWDADPADTRYWATFAIGQSRTFHNRANAERKAKLWRAHGCKVRLDTSEVIAWCEGEAE